MGHARKSVIVIFLTQTFRKRELRRAPSPYQRLEAFRGIHRRRRRHLQLLSPMMRQRNERVITGGGRRRRRRGKREKEKEDICGHFGGSVSQLAGVGLGVVAVDDARRAVGGTGDGGDGRFRLASDFGVELVFGLFLVTFAGHDHKQEFSLAL